MTATRTLYRPVGLAELELIRASGMRRFPPRLPEQPIFYPVLNREYARQIAEQWDAKDSSGRGTQAGFVTEFDVPVDYLERFAEHTVGSSIHRELWVPAEELDEFNRQIVGQIRVTEAFYGTEYSGPRFDLDTLNAAIGQRPMNDRLSGILLGTAVGDALGLPAEGLSTARRRRLMPGPWRHRLVFGRGMLSDDTEHTLFVAQSLLRHPDDSDAFQRRLAWHLRWWFAALPAGIGRATAKACLKLWFGFPLGRSGVFSAGNGPAMRSALIGGYFHDQPEMLRRFTLASTRLTHTDPKAAVGAEAVARVAAWAVEHDPTVSPDLETIATMLSELAPDDLEWCRWIERMPPAIAAGKSVSEFAKSLGLGKGVTGYIYHTVPIAIYSWLHHYGDFRETVEAALDCGGDTDTVGAIAGALAGATAGAAGIPEAWLSGICDWPRTVRLLRTVAERLENQLRQGSPLGEVRYFWPAVLPRNLFFLLVVLFHGFRRLLPPY